MKTCLTALCLFILGCITSTACTIFSAAKDGLVLVGNSEDWNDSESYIKFIPPHDGKYGRVFFGFGNNCLNPFGGVNDRGLFYDMAALTPRTDIEFDPDKEKANYHIYERMLEECADVEQATDFLSRYNLTGMIRHHISIADRLGQSAVIEWGKDALAVIRKTGDYQVVTNFNLTDPSLAGWYPCRRYQTADRMLKAMNELSVDYFRTILDAVHSGGGEYPTVYSNVYDLTNGVIHLYYNHDFEHCVTIDVGNELQKGERVVYLPSLFSPNAKPLSPSQEKIIDQTDLNIPPRNPGSQPNLIDLTPFYNSGLTGSWHSMDMLPPALRNAANDFAALETGVRTLAGTLFDIRGMVHVGGRYLENIDVHFPEKIEGIPVAQTCAKLHFLHGAEFTGETPYGTQVGQVLIHYADDLMDIYPLILGKNIADWWSQPGEPVFDSNLIVAWNGTNDLSRKITQDFGDKRTIRLLKCAWVNPNPEKKIITIDYVSSLTDVSLFLIAVTTE